MRKMGKTRDMVEGAALVGPVFGCLRSILEVISRVQVLSHSSLVQCSKNHLVTPRLILMLTHIALYVKS